jgi:predicted dehydrogenase
MVGPVRVGVVGCGRAAAIHVGRLRALDGVIIAGLADRERAAAEALAAPLTGGPNGLTPVFTNHLDMLAAGPLDAVAIFTPHRAHFRPAIDALQAGCHVFVEKPISTNPQEADDLVRVAAARGLKVGVGHQYRLCGSLIEARRLLAAGTIGRIRLVTATLALPWLAHHSGPEDSWRADPRASGGGIVADAGDHVLDALLWTTGHPAVEVAAIQERLAPGLDVVAAAALRLAGGIAATIAVSGVSASHLFELAYEGENGRLRVTDTQGWLILPDSPPQPLAVTPTQTSVDGDFIAAIQHDRPPCCPADQALDTVRLTEAIARSAASGQLAQVGGSAKTLMTGLDSTRYLTTEG